MALKGALILLCSLAVSSFSHDETLLQNCTLNPQLLLAHLKVAVECSEDGPSAWGPQVTAALLLSMRNLSETLHKHQLHECHGAESKMCPEPEVPDHGGLACVTVDNSSYCKPMCNYGYDFAFIRRSRLYDECNEQTGYKWKTQYVGGNKLAVCNKASIQVSGAKTAYFPKDRDCLATKSGSQLQNTIEEFTTELRNEGIQANFMNACLLCG